jgi:hypothetical protein
MDRVLKVRFSSWYLYYLIVNVYTNRQISHYFVQDVYHDLYRYFKATLKVILLQLVHILCNARQWPWFVVLGLGLYLPILRLVSFSSYQVSTHRDAGFAAYMHICICFITFEWWLLKCLEYFNVIFTFRKLQLFSRMHLSSMWYYNNHE